MSLKAALVALAAGLLLTACSDTPVEAPQAESPVVRHTLLTVDPNPSASGYFLAGKTFSDCWEGTNHAVVANDYDMDWLDDGCELALAQAFAPAMILDINDECPGYLAFWGAKVIGDIVRLVYLPAYFRDCGLLGHLGDSEMVTIEIRNDQTTKHWYVVQMWTSAHYQSAEFGFHFDDSRWTHNGDLSYTDKLYGYPWVFANKNKHANFPSQVACNLAASYGGIRGTCHNPGTPARFIVLSNRNIGGRFNDFLGAVTIPTGTNPEYFFTQSATFGGWQTTAAAQGAGAYYGHLMSEKFESRDGNWGYGPGTVTAGWANINGTGTMQPGNTCQWTATSSVGPDAIYEWRVNGALVGTQQVLSYSANYDFTLEVFVYNGFGGASTTWPVHVGYDVSPCFAQ